MTEIEKMTQHLIQEVDAFGPDAMEVDGATGDLFAAIARREAEVRAEALEEAAKVSDEWNELGPTIAAEIRALIKEQP